MSLYESWMKKTPKNPRVDLSEFKNSKKSVSEWKNLLNSTDINGIRQRWNILSLVCCWDCPLQVKKEIIKELILMGVDMDIQGLSGLGPIHVLVIKIVWGEDQKNDEELLHEFIKKGVNYHAKCFLSFGESMVYSPYQLLQLLLLEKDQKRWRRYIPKYTKLSSTGTSADISSTCKMLRLLNEPMSVGFSIQDMDDFQRDVIMVRFKIPSCLSHQEIAKRAAVAWKYRDHIDYEQAKQERMKHFHDTAIYINSCFMDVAEFMPFEFVRLEEDGKQFYFHKKMLPSIWRSSMNPFTRKNIPFSTLSQWYEESVSPFIYEITTLEQSMKEDGFFGSNPLSLDHQEGFFYLHTLLVHSHPYSNVYNIYEFTLPQLWHLCTFLANAPFRFQCFQRILHMRDSHQAKRLFLQHCFHLMEKGNFLHNLHFALEECLLDFQMTERFLVLCKKEGILFHRNSLFSACHMIVELYEMLLERVGVFDDHSFNILWRRLCNYHDMTIDYTSSKSSSSSVDNRD